MNRVSTKPSVPSTLSNPKTACTKLVRARDARKRQTKIHQVHYLFRFIVYTLLQYFLCIFQVIDQANGMYRCEKCDREYPNFKYRLIAAVSICRWIGIKFQRVSIVVYVVFKRFYFFAQMSLSDWSGNQWVTAFTDEAEMILGGSSEELGEMKDTDPNMFTEKISEAGLKSYVFKLKVKLENFSVSICLD